MNEKDAWKNFTNSGSVNDYLRYASIKKEQINSPVRTDWLFENRI